MRLIVDIPNSLYANLAKIGNGSIAGKRIIDCVKHGKPYKVDLLEDIKAEIENDWQLKKFPSSPFSCGLRKAIEIIDKYRNEVSE